MTKQEAIDNVRSLLDEVDSDGFYLDDEIELELTNSQNELLRIVYTNYKNRLIVEPETIIEEVLRSSLDTLESTLGTGLNSFSVPNGYFGWQTVFYSLDQTEDRFPLAYQREINAKQARLQENIYLKSTSNEPYFEVNESEFVFEQSIPAAQTGKYKLVYFKYASEPISTMPEKVHSIIVQGAFASIVRKDADSHANSGNEYNKFITQVNEIL